MGIIKEESIPEIALLIVPFMSFNPLHHLHDQGGTASGFANNGIKTVLSVGRVEGELKNLNFEVIETGNLNRLNLISIFRETRIFLRTLVNYKPQLVLVWNVSIFPLIAGILMKPLSTLFKLRMKTVLRLDWDGIYRNLTFFERILFKVNLKLSCLAYDHLTTETSCGYSLISKFLPEPSKLKFIPVGLARENHNGEKTISREKIVLTVGKIAKYKNISESINVFGAIANKFSDWKYVIIGQWEDKEYFEYLKHMVNELKLENSISFLGEVPYSELYSFFNRASIFLTLSNYESFNLARYEAMEHGLYVISSKAGCASDFHGIVVVDDTESAINALEHAISLLDNGSIKIPIRYEAVRTWTDIAKLYLTLKR